MRVSGAKSTDEMPSDQPLRRAEKSGGPRAQNANERRRRQSALPGALPGGPRRMTGWASGPEGIAWPWWRSSRAERANEGRIVGLLWIAREHACEVE